MGGPLPWATAAPTVPQGPVATTRTAVTPVLRSIPAQAVVSAQSTTAGAKTVLAEVPASDTETFNLVGASWTKLSGQVTLQVQTKSASGWSDWTDLSTEDSASAVDTPSATGVNSVGDPLYVGDSTGIALRALGGAGASITGLTAKAVTSPAVADDAHLATVTAQAVAGIGVPQPSIISRAGWGAAESLRTSCSNGTYDTTIKAAVIHHTAGTNDYTVAQSASIVRGIYAYHVQANGWCDIGYNFLVDKYGQIFEGRFGGIALPVHGAHAGSWNTNTMGVSFMMNSSTAQVSEASMSSAASLLAWKLAGYYRDPEGRTTVAGVNLSVIFGHGEVMSTDCPGTNLRARLQELRDRTRDQMAGRQQTPLYNLWAAAGGDVSGFGPV
ncbi:MAG TPA: N-acetylmuramoyl-L-alanine amidase, partial [Propionibacteriaceae bacterium]